MLINVIIANKSIKRNSIISVLCLLDDCYHYIKYQLWTMIYWMRDQENF